MSEVNLEDRRFVVKDNITGEDILGGEVSIDNAAIAYGYRIIQGKRPSELSTYEYCKVEYKMCGGQSFAHIQRVV